MIHYQESQYGFEWGSAKVERFFSDHKKGWVTLGITTTKANIQVYITKTGKVRIHDKGREWFPKEEIPK